MRYWIIGLVVAGAYLFASNGDYEEAVRQEQAADAGVTGREAVRWSACCATK